MSPRIRVKSFEAWVEMEGVELASHCIHVEGDPSTVAIGWIASEAGKVRIRMYTDMF